MLRWILFPILLPFRLALYLWFRFGMLFLRGNVLFHSIPDKFTATVHSGLLFRIMNKQEMLWFHYLGFLNRVARDPGIQWVLLSIPDLEDLEWSQIEEIRIRLQEIRDSGKRTVGHAERGGLKTLCILSGCERRYLSPGHSFITALPHAEPFFFASALKNWGVRVEVHTAGEFKSAGEALSRDSMSPSARENLEELLDARTAGILSGLTTIEFESGPGQRRTIQETLRKKQTEDLHELIANRSFLEAEELYEHHFCHGLIASSNFRDLCEDLLPYWHSGEDLPGESSLSNPDRQPILVLSEGIRITDAPVSHGFPGVAERTVEDIMKEQAERAKQDQTSNDGFSAGPYNGAANTGSERSEEVTSESHEPFHGKEAAPSNAPSTVAHFEQTAARASSSAGSVNELASNLYGKKDASKKKRKKKGRIGSEAGKGNLTSREAKGDEPTTNQLPARGFRILEMEQLEKRLRRKQFQPFRIRRYPSIALVSCEGMIVWGQEQPDSGRIGARSMRKIFEELEESKNEAIFLYINSPGGLSDASEALYQDIYRLSRSKPVFAVLGPVAASGGYYMACAANRIYSPDLSLTGSVGVLRMRPEISGLYKKLGIKKQRVRFGPTTDILSESGTLGQKSKALLDESMDRAYTLFLDRVGRSRGMDRQATDSRGKGKVYTGAMFRKEGMVDRKGGFMEALKDFRKEAGYAQDQPFDIQIYPVLRPGPADLLKEGPSFFAHGSALHEMLNSSNLYFLDPRLDTYLGGSFQRELRRVAAGILFGSH